jgi:cell pole-organizing protein PopZ
MPEFGKCTPIPPDVREGQDVNAATVTVEDQVAKVADRLATEYSDRVSMADVKKMVDAAYRPMKKAKVTQFVPVLVDRTVREQLRVERV